MARQHQRKVINAISIENTAIAEYLDDGAVFRKYPGDPQPPTFPTRTNVPDEMVGDGKAYMKQSKPYYYDALNKPYSGALTSTIGVRWFRTWLGGTIGETSNVGFNTIDSVIQQLEPGLEPMTFNELRANGGAQFLFGDVFVQTIEISQTGASEPRISVTKSNGGHHAEIADTNIDVLDIEDQDTYLKYDGKRTKLTFSDGVTSYDFAAEKRLIDVSFTGNQNVNVEQLPGDSPIDASNECEGGYTENLTIDVQDATMRVKVYMDETFAQFASWKANRKLTSVKLIFSTCEKIGTSTHHAEYEIQFPIAEFNLTPDNQNNYDAFSFEIKAIEGDAVTGSLVIGRIRQVGSVDETV